MSDMGMGEAQAGSSAPATRRFASSLSGAGVRRHFRRARIARDGHDVTASTAWGARGGGAVTIWSKARRFWRSGREMNGEGRCCPACGC